MTLREACVLTLLVYAPLAAGAAPPAAEGDPVLASLLQESLRKNPEYARARAELAAERERVPQAGALGDPTLTLGIQNDGFRRIEIGDMETSFWQVMVTQPLPWPGKRGLREDAARSAAGEAEAAADRIRLTTMAQVERAYVDLLLVRGQVRLLRDLDVLWGAAEAVARARYEVGAAPQSDLIRAQLERTRIAQQLLALDASERERVQALNRLRVHPLDEPIETPRRISEIATPQLPSAEEACADAERRSPDLAQARRSAATAERSVALARRERYPDFTVSAGVMPRGGLDPMWTASVGVTLPIFAGRKQLRAVAESESRREAAAQDAESIRQILLLRTRERLAALHALLETIRLYRERLLVQSDAAVRSTTAQYRVGKETFASVIEVMRGFIADESGYLDALAQAQRVAIAQRELSLDPVPEVSWGGGGMGGAGGMSAGARVSRGGGMARAPTAGAASGGM